uniref:hypothetical protein n=1 Tax=Orrella sp. TaxID=1921583 RepID=UPI004048B49D
MRAEGKRLYFVNAGISRLGACKIMCTVRQLIFAICGVLFLPITAFARYSDELYGDAAPSAPGFFGLVIMVGGFLFLFVASSTFRTLVIQYLLMLVVIGGAVWVIYEVFGKDAMLTLLLGCLALYLYFGYFSKVNSETKDSVDGQSVKNLEALPSRSHGQSTGSTSDEAAESHRSPRTLSDDSASANKGTSLNQTPKGAKICLRRTDKALRAYAPESRPKRTTAVETFKERMDREKREKGIRKALVKVLVLSVLVIGVVLDLVKKVDKFSL